MGIGTSIGAHFETDFDLQAGREYTPPEIKPKNELSDSNVRTPNEVQQNKQLNDIEMQELGGSPIRMRIYPQGDKLIETGVSLDDSLYPYEGGTRHDRYREDEPGIREWVDRENRYGIRSGDEGMVKHPNNVLGIDPTNDKNELHYGILDRRPGGLVHRTRYEVPNEDLPKAPFGVVGDLELGLDPPKQTTPTPRSEPVVLFKTKTGVDITDHDIDDAMNVAMSAGPGTINVKNYINHFLKPPVTDVPKPAIPELDPTEKAIKAIMDVLEGPGSYDAKYPPKPTPTTQQIINEHPDFQYGDSYVKQPNFEQVPFGYSDGEWAQMSPYQKKKILNNPPEPEPGSPLSKQVFPGHSMSPKEAYSHYSDLKETGFADAAENLWNEYASKASVKQWKEFGAMSGNKYKIPIKDTENKNFKIEGGKWIEDDEVIMSALKDAHDGKLSTFDKINNTIEQVKARLLNTYIHERARFHTEKLKDTIPKEALEAGYTEQAFRGIKNRGEIKPEHNYEKTNHMYSSDSPLLADMYAEYLSKHPGWDKIKEGAFTEGASVAPLVINTKNYHVFDAKGSDWQSANNKAIIEAVQQKKPGVIVKNVWDEPNSTRALGKPATVYITFPSGAGTVKSRHASKFDSSSPNMLHMVPVLAVGGAAGYVSKQVSEDE